ncbi:type II secretion system F family protein [Microbacterium aurum]
MTVADTYKDEAELQDKIRSATTYPLIVLSIAILGVIAMVTFVVPIFKGMFENLGSELPLPTQILVTMSNNMFWMLPLGIVGAIAFWLWWVRNRNEDRVRKVVDPLKLRMPVFGPLATKIAVARFSRSLSMMLKAGVPLVQALSIVGQAANNYKVEEAVRAVQESVKQGKSFSTLLAKAEVFPAMVAQMVAVGEESGTLPDMLASIADFYEGEVKTATEQLTSAIEPILIVGIGIIIGGMVISLYMPIFSIYAANSASPAAEPGSQVGGARAGEALRPALPCRRRAGSLSASVGRGGRERRVVTGMPGGCPDVLCQAARAGWAGRGW